MLFIRLAVPLLLLPWSAAVGDPVNVRSPGEGQTVTVMITDSGYSPAAVTVRHGDVLRFVQMDVRSHNVEFRGAPRGARMVPEHVPPLDPSVKVPTALPPLRIGPYLHSPGETYEVPIDQYMPEGAYLFGCSSHDGWRGVLVVEDFDDLP